MGQEIEEVQFTPDDFVEYADRLRAETALLGEWFSADIFSPRDRMGGFELEAWLIDSRGRPAPVNETFLKHLDNPMVVPELARFNVELNDHPQHLWGDMAAMPAGSGRAAVALVDDRHPADAGRGRAHSGKHV